MSIVSFSFKKKLSFKKKPEPKPLVSSSQDVQLVRQVHKRKLPEWKQIRHFKRLLSVGEKKVLNWSLGVLLIGIIWLGYSLITAKQIEVPAVGGSYTEAVIGAPELINPLFASVNDVDLDMTRLVYSGLMRHNEHQQLIPDLAASYTVNDAKTVYTFTLRQDVVWHDHTEDEPRPFTAEDVVFTFEAIQNADVNSPLLVTFEGVLVEAIDANTVQFTLPEPFNPFLSSLTVGMLPEHIWSTFSPERIRLAQHNLKPIGTGPFVAKTFEKDSTGFISSYTFERFESFYDQPPFLEEFTFKFFVSYEGGDGAIAALREQKVDGIHFVPHDLRERVERKHITLHTLQLPQYTALFFNGERQSFLEDKDLRNALALSLDKERIARESLQGESRVIYSPILPGFPGHQEDIEKTAYSIEQANELLDADWDRVSQEEYRAERKEAIITELQEVIDLAASSTALLDDGDENVVTTTPEQLEEEANRRLEEELNEAQTFYRKDEDGNVLTLRLVTADTQEYRKAAPLIAGAWQDIGVHTRIEYVSPQDISRDALKDRDYDILLYGIIVGSDPDQYPFWHSSQIEAPGLNLSQYVNRAADELLEKARESSDEAEIAQLYSEFQTILLTDMPAVFLYMPIYTYATQDTLQGTTLSRIFVPSDRFAGVTNWYVKTKRVFQE